MPSSIPAFYRIFFTIVDPLMCIGGVFGNLLAPAAIVGGYTSSPAFPIAPETTVLLNGGAGWFAGMAFMQAYLLRAEPNNLKVWQSIQVAMTLVDVFMLFGLARSLIGEKGLETALWNGQDWGNMIGYSLFCVIRLTFLAGVGLGKGKTA